MKGFCAYKDYSDRDIQTANTWAKLNNPKCQCGYWTIESEDKTHYICGDLQCHKIVIKGGAM